MLIDVRRSDHRERSHDPRIVKRDLVRRVSTASSDKNNRRDQRNSARGNECTNLHKNSTTKNGIIGWMKEFLIHSTPQRTTLLGACPENEIMRQLPSILPRT